MPLDVFHPIVADWFRERFGAPTEAQARGWAEIASGRDTLIMAPTGSGKTLAAFLYGLDALVRRAVDGRLGGQLDEQVRILYISPLKALGADVERNLQAPLRGIEASAIAHGRLLPPIRTALRTGDTSQADRARILRRPPHVLITTPESLYLLLTSVGGRAILGNIEAVIVDEIHALVGNKRGAHLALSLERLDAHVMRSHQNLMQPHKKRPVRIGLSATVEPPSAVARFLTGVDAGGAARDCRLVDAGRTQRLDLAVEVPKETLAAVASRTAWGDVYQRLQALISEHKTSLVFVPSRRMCERVAHDLEERMGEGIVAAHHGALAKRTRQSVEKRLQTGQLRAVVATASLELGIDIGDVELVCQMGSPRSIAVLRQRIGRAGHAVGGTPKGRIFALTRDELVECAAAVRAMRGGMIDRPVMRDAPLDILAQQLVATCAAAQDENGWNEDELFALVRRSSPYAALERREFDQVLAMLGDGIATRRGRAGAHLHLDRVNRRARGRRGARLAALTSGGAIPDKADYQVIEDPSEAVVGTLDEDFAIESMAGDIFLLGSTSWRIRRVENGRVRVENAHGLPPSIPFWNGEGLARSEELSNEVGRLRRELADRDRDSAVQLLVEDCAVERAGAEQAADYVHEAARALGAVPTQEQVVAERFFDESGGMQLILHAPFGARVNRAWGLALRKKFCRTFDFELQAAATDDAVLLSLGPQHSFPLDAIFGFLQPGNVEETLIQAVLPAPMWETRWRWNAVRALAVLRFTLGGGKRTPPQLVRMRAADLAAAVFPAQAGCQDNHGGGDLELPDHPLVNETARDCLREAMDVDGLKRVLQRLRSGAIATLARDTVAPSPWSHGILAANPYAYLDDAPLEERRTRAVSTSRPGELDSREAGLVLLDGQAIAQVVDEVRPDPRDADELHDYLCSAAVVPARAAWRPLFEELRAANRAAVLERGGGAADAWVPAERIALVRAVWPDARLVPALAAPLINDAREWDPEEACAQLAGAHLQTTGPQTAAAVAAALGLDEDRINAALARLEADGQILRGRFTPGGSDEEWCERRILQRIHRRTLGRLREDIRPVTPAELIRFLLRWQHVAPGTRLHGVEGVAKVIEQLEGLQLQPAAWERDVLPARVEGYQPAWLDELCLSGEVAWARLELAPPVEDSPSAARPRNASGAIGLFLRAHASWLIDRGPPFGRRGSAEDRSMPAAASPTPTSPATWAHLSPPARAVAAELEKRGAAFAADLCAALGRAPSEIDDALWELVRTGAVSSDGFSGLRALVARNEARPRRLVQGRWSLIHRDAPPPAADAGPFHDGSPVEHARVYLRRYGVVLRALLERETCAPPWRELVAVYRRLEARGEIRGGRFVSGLSGEQFALPEAVEALRALRRIAATPYDADAVVAATDPLNLVGILTPGPRVPAVAGHSVRYQDGVPAAALRSLA